MGIREDVDKGLCSEEYILVKSAVKVLANQTRVSPQEVARWLLKNDLCMKVYTHAKDKFGQMKIIGKVDSMTKKVSRVASAEKSREALHLLIESSSRHFLPVYWHIETLAEALSKFNEDVDSKLFKDQAAKDRARATTPDANSKTSTSTTPDMLNVLRARVKELEEEVTRLKSAPPAQTNGFEYCAPSGRLTFNYETKGLLLVAAVQERYLGTNYDPQDADTRPAKAHVIDWLKSEKGVGSDVAAAAIDRVAMPFERGK
jgi:hypothetical protein